MFPKTNSREIKFTVPQVTSYRGICFVAKQMDQTGEKQKITFLTKANFMICPRA